MCGVWKWNDRGKEFIRQVGPTYGHPIPTVVLLAFHLSFTIYFRCKNHEISGDFLFCFWVLRRESTNLSCSNLKTFHDAHPFSFAIQSAVRIRCQLKGCISGIPSARIGCRTNQVGASLCLCKSD